MTRVPSLLMATVSDRLIKARSCESPDAGAAAPSEGNITVNELSTCVECIVRKRNSWISKLDLLLLLQRCFTTPMALTCTMSAITSPRSSQTPLVTIRSITPAFPRVVRLKTDWTDDWERCLSRPITPCFNLRSVSGESRDSEDSS